MLAGSLIWQLADGDEPGVLSLSLPVTGDQARALLRGQVEEIRLPSPVLNEAGRPSDIVATGWPGLYAISHRMVNAFQGLTGWQILAYPTGAASFLAGVLCITGRCGSVDYSKSLQIKKMGDFVRLRGIRLNAGAWDGSDLAVPDNREVIVASEDVASRVDGMTNVRLTRLDSVEFDVSGAWPTTT